MKNKIIRQPALNVTHIIIFLIMCVIALWLNIDNKANIEQFVKSADEKYITCFLLLVVLYLEMAQFVTMENCQRIKKFYISLYYLGISFIISSTIASYYHKSIFLIISCCIGVILSASIIVYVIKRNGIPKYLKITINDFVKVKNDKAFQRFSVAMALSQVVNFIASIIIFSDYNSLKLVNWLLASWLIILLIFQIIKTYRIPSFVEKNKRRYFYNIISPIVGFGTIFLVNNILFIDNSNLFLGVFSIAVAIVTTISSDIEIYYKIVQQFIRKN